MFALEELRQIYVSSSGLSDRFENWWSSNWNKSDLVIILLYLVAFTTHAFYMYVQPDDSSPNCPLELDHYMYSVQILYCLAFLISMVRTMHFLIVFDNIGPKILALRHMAFDVISFFALFTIFSLTYGTISQSVLYPNEWRWDRVLRGIAFKSYFHIFGELFAGETSVYIGEDHDEVNITCDGSPSMEIFVNQTSGKFSITNKKESKNQ